VVRIPDRASTVFVARTGNDADSGRSAARAFATVHKAASVARPVTSSTCVAAGSPCAGKGARI
jgi:hypothetical protein